MICAHFPALRCIGRFAGAILAIAALPLIANAQCTSHSARATDMDALFVPVSESKNAGANQHLTAGTNQNSSKPSKPPCHGCYRHGSQQPGTPPSTSSGGVVYDLMGSNFTRLFVPSWSSLWQFNGHGYSPELVSSIDHPPRSAAASL